MWLQVCEALLPHRHCLKVCGEIETPLVPENLARAAVQDWACNKAMWDHGS